MAKSTRSKVKRHYRAKKREEGVYAAVEAARLERLSAKLAAVKESKKIAAIDGDDANECKDEEHGLGKSVDGEEIEAEPTDSKDNDGMELDQTDTSSTQKISTHGPRNSRHEQWRASKGMTPRAKSRGMNRQGGLSAKHRAGRPKRRR